LNGATSGYENYCEGINLTNSPRTDVLKNNIYNTGWGIFFSGDDNNGIIGCNLVSGAYHGFELLNAIWGEYALNPMAKHHFEIGRLNNPYNNGWINISTTKRVFGSVYSPNYYFDFYYKNSPNFLLNQSYYAVTGNFSTYQTSDANFCNIPPIESPGGLYNLSTTSALSNYRDKYIGFVIDTLNLSTSNLMLSNNNPQGIYNDNIRYSLIKNAFYYYKSKSFIQNIGLSSDVMYNAFKQIIESTNIGKIYNIDQEIKLKNFNSASNILQTYNPSNLSEINTYTVYGIYINYLKNDSLSGQDSADLNAIAYQNHLIGGSEVNLARNLLGIYVYDAPIQINAVIRKANSINENQNKDLFVKIYPNPASNIVNVSMSNNKFKNTEYIIYSIEGKLIKSGKLQNKSNNSIDISDIESGLYYLHIINDDGTNILIEKLIKQ